jgi:hypothetical protein
MKKITVASLLVAALLLTNNVFAGLILPESSFDNGRWSGHRIYEENGYKVLVDFAVYDTQGENEFVTIGEFTAPGEGRYIYAYQIFNHPDAQEDIGYFGIFASDGNSIDGSVISGLGSQNDNEGGKQPSNERFDAATSRIVWEFGWDELAPGLHSYFLVFSSNSAPVAGDYQVSKLQDTGEPPVPDGHTPEPATVALLGIGALTVIRRKKAAWKHRAL